MQRLLTRANLCWLLAYLLVVGGLVFQLVRVRPGLIARLSDDSAQAEWDKWRADAAKAGQPVARRPPKSPEPPTLVLLRDHFPMCLTVTIVFSSLLFAVVMITFRGALRHSERGDRQPIADSR